VVVWEEAKLKHEQTVLSTLQEVSNALISVQEYREVQVQQACSVKAYEEAVEVSLKRYVAGKASYCEVLQNQQNLFQAETVLAQTELTGWWWYSSTRRWAAAGRHRRVCRQVHSAQASQI
jgi:outer membrane protein TolC